MTSIRDGNGKIKANVLIGSVVAAMIAAMVPATLAISNNIPAEAQDMMGMPYVKVFAGNAMYEPNAGKTNVFGPGGYSRSLTTPSHAATQ